MLLETIKSFVIRHKEKCRISDAHAVQPPQNSLQLIGKSKELSDR
jgi:hypothetical protein